MNADTDAINEGLDAFVWGFAMLWVTGIALQFSGNNRRGLWRPAGEPCAWRYGR